MELSKIIENRYSCRDYTSEAVSEEQLEYIKECVRLAPSAVNKQPWRFRIVKSEEGKRKLRECYDREWFATAPMYIIYWYGDKKNTAAGSAVTDGAVNSAGTLGTDTIYAAVVAGDKYTDGDVIATLPASTDGTAYGQMKKYVIRLWLEGEDPECWNANAGQDWTIAMKFSKVTPPAQNP